MVHSWKHLLGYIQLSFPPCRVLTVYIASRGLVIHAWGKDKITSRDKVSASAIAGGVAGTAGGLLSNLQRPVCLLQF